jgi:heptosyltransferase II
VMSMPAIETYRSANPSVKIAVLARPSLRALWEMHPAINKVVSLHHGMGGLIRSVQTLREDRASVAFVFPNSFRSALIPFLAGIPRRRGARGHHRSWLLTETVPKQGDEKHVHQAGEYAAILGSGRGDVQIAAPSLTVPESALQKIRIEFERRLEGRRWIALMPGAARGPSKRWPAEHFSELCRMLVKDTGYAIVLLGSSEEFVLGRMMEETVRCAGVLNLIGQTTLTELAAALKLCAVAVSNDSGGMHLATAVGTPVVAVFGMTDPARTGPMGAGNRVVTGGGGVHVSRDIQRHSRRARDCLRSIQPRCVFDAVTEILAATLEVIPHEGR